VIDVPQDPDLALFCSTVQKELAYGPADHRMSPDAVSSRVRDAAEALSIDDLLDRPPQALSRGQRLRVAVAACLACTPDVLILDEPTAGQDREQVERMMDGLRESMSSGALIFATHDLELARRHSTRILVMEDGKFRKRTT
jgi:energy-coupling factor transporter ATP-binding protein EcfA2